MRFGSEPSVGAMGMRCTAGLPSYMHQVGKVSEEYASQSRSGR